MNTDKTTIFFCENNINKIKNYNYNYNLEEKKTQLKKEVIIGMQILMYSMCTLISLNEYLFFGMKYLCLFFPF